VSIAKRLYNLARAELREALGGLGRPTLSFEPSADRAPEPEPEREPPPRRRRGSADLDDAELRRYYANLELPLGAPAAEVKAAYRRLMRRYHPDRHQNDPEQARVATLLAQELSAAYEALMRHLER
jgi:DnaJ-domain-containing protein 1